MPHDPPIISYQPQPSKTRPVTALRFWLLVLLSAIAGLTIWCFLDFLYVRFNMKQALTLDLALLAFPLVVFLFGLRHFNTPSPGRPIVLAFLAALLATLLSLVFIALFGIAFHFYIGGKL
jgi:hypothetical protein